MSADVRTGNTGPAVPRPGITARLGAWWSRSNVAANDPYTPPPLGAETQVPPEALDAAQGIPLDDQLQTLMTGALRMGEARAQGQAYLQGYRDGVRGEWWWGFTCGATAIAVGGLVLAIVVAAVTRWGMQ